MRHIIYVTLDSIICFSSPALICLADQSIRELSSDSDSKCSISRPGSDKNWPNTTGDIRLRVLLCHSGFPTWFSVPSYAALTFLLIEKKKGWLVGVVILNLIGICVWVLLHTSVSWLPSSYAHFAVHDQEYWSGKTEVTHLPDQKFQYINMNSRRVNRIHAC